MTTTTELVVGDRVHVRHDPKTRRLQTCEAGDPGARPMIWLGGEAYAHPDLEPLLVPIESVKRHPRNPRRGDQTAITESVATSGLYGAIRVQRSSGHIVAGNHTMQGVADLGGQLVARIALDMDDDEALRVLTKDNATSDRGQYDNEELFSLLEDMAATEAGLLGSGYDADEMKLLGEEVAAAEHDSHDDDTDDRAPTTSEMLAIADVTWGEPKHQPRHGQVWSVGPHTLVIAKVSAEHHRWRHLLTDETLFCPYPEPYITTTEAALTHHLLLVQPNTYLAGHLLDKHLSTHPEDTLALLHDGHEDQE